MIGTAVTFLAIGIADLVAGGLKGSPAGRRRAIAGLAAAALVTLAGGSFVGWSGALVAVAAANLAILAAWMLSRTAKRFSRRQAASALAALTAYLALGAGSEGLWGPGSVAGLGRWLETLAFPALNLLEPDALLLLAALFVFLAATTNGIVRTVLAAAGTDTRRSEARLRGGRVIGVLERWIICALMLSGEPTAAGLIVSAKSILRFPELNRVAREPADDPSAVGTVDHVTEYFLLGSLTSWLVAAVLALLFVGPF